jgi:AcrR family transcriptional regulator
MTAKRIKEVALKHFAAYGYSGSSLAHIAEDVGIKKPSLYAHFKGKDDLFLSVLKDVFDEETAALLTYLSSNPASSLHDQLYGFLEHYKARYEQSERTKFMLRMSYFPPTALYDQVMVYVYTFLDGLEAKLVSLFTQATGPGNSYSFDPHQAAKAYLCLMDGVLVEMLYGGDKRFKQRLDASWNFYWLGMQAYKH